MRIIVPLLLTLVSACSGVRTNDVIMDDVLRRESSAFSPLTCLHVHGRTNVFRSDPSGPPAMLEAKKVHDPEARRAAGKIEIDWNTAPAQTSTVIGEDTQGNCPMSISRPIRSGNFAFVSFSGPSAKIGAYVYQRSGRAWRYLEEVELGFW